MHKNAQITASNWAGAPLSTASHNRQFVTMHLDDKRLLTIVHSR